MKPSAEFDAIVDHIWQLIEERGGSAVLDTESANISG